MASRRSRSHADWLGVGRKELCRRVVSRPRRAVSRLRSNNPCRLIPPLPSPYRSDRLVIIHVFLLVDAQVARPPYLHNGARHAVALLKCFFLFFFSFFDKCTFNFARLSFVAVSFREGCKKGIREWLDHPCKLQFLPIDLGNRNRRVCWSKRESAFPSTKRRGKVYIRGGRALR